MPITLKKGEQSDKAQRKVKKLYKSMQEMRRQEKRKILQAIASSIVFNKYKTPLKIQKEMRDEWD